MGFVATYVEIRWYQNPTEGDPNGSREEKIRNLKRMLHDMGPQSERTNEDVALQTHKTDVES